MLTAADLAALTVGATVINQHGDPGRYQGTSPDGLIDVIYCGVPDTHAPQQLTPVARWTAPRTVDAGDVQVATGCYHLEQYRRWVLRARVLRAKAARHTSDTSLAARIRDRARAEAAGCDRQAALSWELALQTYPRDLCKRTQAAALRSPLPEGTS